MKEFKHYYIIIPILTLLLLVIISSFNDGFMTKYNSIDNISPVGNPYISELMFDDLDKNDMK